MQIAANSNFRFQDAVELVAMSADAKCFEMLQSRNHLTCPSAELRL